MRKYYRPLVLVERALNANRIGYLQTVTFAEMTRLQVR